MTNIHNNKLDNIEFADEKNVKFDENNKLGEVLGYYWENDKCIFSKLYKTLQQRNIFNALNTYANGQKVKLFHENTVPPHVNIFLTTF